MSTTAERPIGVGSHEPARRRRLPRVIECVFIVVAAATCTAGYLLPMHGHRLGAPSPPFYGFFDPVLTPWLPLSAAALIGLALAAPRTLAVSPRTFLLLSAPLALLTRIVLNVGRHGPDELVRPLTGRPGQNDVLSSLHLFTSHPLGFLQDFPDRVATLRLPVHVMGHPPGPTVIVGALSAVGLGGAWPAAAAILVLGALGAPLVYLLATELTDDRIARLAVLVWIFAPSVLLESATSMDAVFVTAGIGTILLFVRRGLLVPATAAVVCSFLSYALIGAVSWALLLLALRGRWRRAMVLALATLAAAAVFYGGLWMATGYDPLAAYRATSFAYAHGVATRRPDWYWPLGDLTAFLIALGPLVALGFARALGMRSDVAFATMAILGVAALAGFSKAEVERIWLFLTPLVAIAAAPELRSNRPNVLLLTMVSQALVVEIAFGTTW